MIEVRGLTKRFGGVLALDGLDLDFALGEIHAICGENGAGKSTLNRLLAGILRPDAGEIVLAGRRLRGGSVREAEAAGVAIVHQEGSAFATLNTGENHGLLHEPTRFGGLWLDRAAMGNRALKALDRLGERWGPTVPLERLSAARRQVAGIARALDRNARLLILDEPTAALSSRETEALFAALKSAREEGVAIVYVSHRLEEVFAISDRVSVLRDGRLVSTRRTPETDRETLIRDMVGREVSYVRRPPATIGEAVLEVRGLQRQGVFQDISLTVRSGEVVALSGLVGAGRSEVAQAIFGLQPADSGEVVVRGKVALVPEDRAHQGLHLPLSIRENLTLAKASRLWRRPREEAKDSSDMFGRLGIRAGHDQLPVMALSGGNQQKVLLGKWLLTSPDVLILDEPTRGVDVSAKAQIHDEIATLAQEGKAILLVSSEIEEVRALADRALILRQGRIVAEIGREEMEPGRLLEPALPRDAEVAETRRPSCTLPREAGLALLLLCLLGAGALASPAFLSTENVRDMLVKVAPAMIVGAAMTLVMVAREIDISVGSLMGLCAAALGIAASPDRLGLPVPVAVALCLGVGASVGALNGLLVGYAGVPSIMVTLGMLTILRGATERLMGGEWIERLPGGVRAFGTGHLFGVPYSVLAALLILVVVAWVARRTAFGLRLTALGTDPTAATVRGVNVRRARLVVFTLTGLAAGVAALFSATQLQVIESGFGQGFELAVIAACVVGGASPRGGRGGVVGTALAATILGIVGTVLIFLKLGPSAVYWERAIQGGVILLAVLADHFARRRPTS